MASRVTDVDVIIQTEIDRAPNCPHGPALLFVRYGGDRDSQRRFYACSAFRDRKECNFFQWEDEKISELKMKIREDFNKSLQPKFTHRVYRKRFLQFKKLPKDERALCQSCGLFLLPEERKHHQGQGHSLLSPITKKMLLQPSKLFNPLENNKTYAQYLFSDSAVQFTLETLKDLEVSHVLCVGAPRIHEAIVSADDQMTSLSLDLDHRYQQIYSLEQYSRYNMFNHHFFDGSKSEEIFKKFIKETDSNKVAMVIDPPFGGMVEALGATINSIIHTWRISSNKSETDILPVMWFFPYFMEQRITECLKEFCMLDYKVDYDNHALFRGDTKKYGSPVRIFTNLRAEQITLPKQEGYWFCDRCKRYSAKENVHCDICDSCPSKDGRTYKHCFRCDRCVKPSKVHCDTCKMCVQKDHKCGTTKPLGCHICGALDHKRKNCSQKDHSASSRKRKRTHGSMDRKTSKKYKYGKGVRTYSISKM